MKPGLLKTTTITGYVFVINCNDRYLKVRDSKNCVMYDVAIDTAKCNSLNLKPYDKVRITYIGKKKRLGMRNYGIKSVKITKIRLTSLTCTVKVVNCNDNYIDLEYVLCRKKILVRAGITREKCNRYRLSAGDKVKVYGAISYDYSHNRIVINNVTKIKKL